MDTLAEFNFEIVHRPGRSNVVPDALSRRPDHCLSEQLFSIYTAQSLCVGDDLPGLIRELATADVAYQRVLRGVRKGTRTDFEISAEPATQGLLRLRGRWYIPSGQRLRARLLEEAHDAPLCGHLGRDKTYERLQRTYYWPKMEHTVNEYCKSCEVCQAIKVQRRGTPGLLQPLPVPNQIFDAVGLDFITQLPRTRSGYTAILTIVDRLSKRLVAVPTVNEVNAVQTAELFWERWGQYFGLPKSLVSDRDPRFTSEFWTSFWKRLGTKFNMSTANHPQTDGQTEKANMTIEDMIRAYVSPHHDDWDEFLPHVVFAYNDSKHASTGQTPFQLTMGRHPNSPLTMSMASTEGAPLDRSDPAWAKEMSAGVKRAKECLKLAQERQRRYANKGRIDLRFERGDKVMVEGDCLRLPGAAGAKQKFASRYYGPYEVQAVVSDVAYKLRFPHTVHAHNVVHVSKLKAHVDGQDLFPDRPEYVPPPPPEVIEGEEHFVVEAFRQHRRYHNTLQYLVKWKGHPESENSYEPAWKLKQDLDKRTFKKMLEAYKKRMAKTKPEVTSLSVNDI